MLYLIWYEDCLKKGVVLKGDNGIFDIWGKILLMKNFLCMKNRFSDVTLSPFLTVEMVERHINEWMM